MAVIDEAFVAILPDTRGFQQALQQQVNQAAARVTLPALTAPAVSGAAAGAIASIAGAEAATLALREAQTRAQTSTLGLANSQQVLSSAVGRGATLLTPLSERLTAAAGASVVLDKANKNATASLLGLGSATGKLDAALLGLRTAIGSTAVIGLGAGALAAIALGKAIRATIANTIEFEEQLNVLRATAGATEEEMTRVSEAAIRLGEDVRLPAVSAADAAEAMNSLVRAGLSVEVAT